MTTAYCMYKSIGKHFRRMSVFDRLDFIIALWSDRGASDLTDEQNRMLEKLAINAQGYVGEAEMKEDRDEVLKMDFGGKRNA